MVWTPRKGPAVTDADLAAVVGWVENEFESLNFDQLDNTDLLELIARYNAPTRPQTGNIIYADGTTYNPGFGEGPYVRSSAGVWLPLATIGGLGGGVRERLTANRTYYVRTDGNNANTGLANTSGGAFLTIQKAIDVACALDMSIYSVTINVADGTYTTPIILKPYLGTGPIAVVGNTSTPANCIISTTSANCISGDGVNNYYTFNGFKTVSTTSGYHISLINYCNVKLSNWEFGASPGGYGHTSVFNYSTLVIDTNYTVSGAAADHWLAFTHGLIVCHDVTITISGSPTITRWARASELAAMRIYSNTYSGAPAAGTKKYDVSMNATMQTAAGTLPGTVAGTFATGGQYA